jgi:hypothetical protein
MSQTETAASGPEAENPHVRFPERRHKPTQRKLALFFKTSAKTGEGVIDVFTEIGTSP